MIWDVLLCFGISILILFSLLFIISLLKGIFGWNNKKDDDDDDDDDISSDYIVMTSLM
jgi:hypothetical protein